MSNYYIISDANEQTLSANLCYGRKNERKGAEDTTVGGKTRGMPVPSLAMLRKKATFSQAELAERAGVGRATISRLERGGNASYETIKRLAEALGTERTRLVQQPRQANKMKYRRVASKDR